MYQLLCLLLLYMKQLTIFPPTYLYPFKNGFSICVCLCYDRLTIICHYWIWYHLYHICLNVRWTKIFLSILFWLTLILQIDKSNVSHKFILYQLSIVLFWSFSFYISWLLWYNRLIKPCHAFYGNDRSFWVYKINKTRVITLLVA